MDDTFICPNCDKVKTRDRASTRNKNLTPLPNHQCKDCMNEKQKVYRNSNPERSKRWRSNSSKKRRENGKHRDYTLKATFGISASEWDEMFLSQDKSCAICGIKEGKFNTDHCHTNGDIRGILCTQCNFLLGHSKDDPEILSKAIEYLNKYNNNKNKSEYGRK